jgi:large subunit ribosomal protein L13
MNATHIVKASEIKRAWYLVDAEGLTLGRVASEVAKILRGKNKPTYSTNIDCGDYVIVINADKVKLTGAKLTQKLYRHHTGYIGGLKEVKAKDMIAKKPEAVIELAVKGMLPKNALGREMIKKLKVYSGAEHEHAAQKPEKLEIKA